MKAINSATVQDIPYYDSVLQIFSTDNSFDNHWEDYATIKNDNDLSEAISKVKNSPKYRISVTRNCVTTYYSMVEILCFQIISRNNDSNGNPFRLILIYDSLGTVIKVIEDRSSSNPNSITYFSDCVQLPKFHLSPSEYKQTREKYSHLVVTDDSVMEALKG